MPEQLRGAGYSTAAIGKWHLGYAKWAYTPTGRGFDSHVGYLQGQTDYYNKTLDGAGHQQGYDFWVNQTRAPDDGSYTMSSYTAEAERLASEVWTAPATGAAKPFFLYYAHQHIHVPLERPPAAAAAAAAAASTGSAASLSKDHPAAACAGVSSFPERQTLCHILPITLSQCRIHCQLHCHKVAYTANYTVTIITKSHTHTLSFTTQT